MYFSIDQDVKKKKKKKKRQRPSPDPNEDSKTKVLRKIFEKNTDDEWDTDDSDSDGSNLDFIGKQFN